MIEIKQPAILYEDDPKSPCSKIPFIKTDKEVSMPSLLFLFEMQENGFEEQEDGKILPIVDAELHQFFSAKDAKRLLDNETYDKVRVAFGLQPLQEAIDSGKEISKKVRENVKKAEEENKKSKSD